MKPNHGDYLYTVELHLAAAQVEYFANLPFTTSATDTPPHTNFKRRVTSALDVTRRLIVPGLSEGSGSRIGHGSVTLNNADGKLDYLIDLVLDGFRMIVRRAKPFPVPAFPDDFTVLFDGLMEPADFGTAEIQLPVRDQMMDFDRELQPVKYAGDNVAPDGLEGFPDDLKGKAKTLSWGRTFDVPLRLVNPQKLIYQAAHNLQDAVLTVKERGLPLSTSVDLFNTQTFGFEAAVQIPVGAAYNGVDLLVIGGTDGRLETAAPGGVGTTRVSQFPAGGTIIGICFGNGLFVAVGGDNASDPVMSTSPDGITWTLRTSNFAAGNAIHGVAAGPGYFVIVGDAGSVATSPDGITWTVRTSDTSSDLRNVAINGATVVAVGDDNTIIVSEDSGVTWAQYLTPWAEDTVTGTFFNCVIYSAELGWALAGGHGALGMIATSPNGRVWTPRTSPYTDPNGLVFWQGLAYAAGQFFIIGVTDQMASSTDGINWVARSNFSAATGFPAWGSTFLLAVEGTFYNGITDGRVRRSSSANAYASVAELEDDSLAPQRGSYGAYVGAEGTYVRLGSSPVGVMTVDLLEGATVADRTAAQIFVRMLEWLGYEAGDWDAAAITALDALNDAETGFAFPEEITALAALTQPMDTIGAWWAPDIDGIITAKRVRTPTTAAIVDNFNAEDLIKGGFRIVSAAAGDRRSVPVWRTIVRYARCYTVQRSDYSEAVPQETRNFLSQEWREVVSEDASVKTVNPLASERVYECYFVSEAAAQAEADRRQGLFKRQRRLLSLVFQFKDAVAALSPGQVIGLLYDRYLPAPAVGTVGRPFLITATNTRASEHQVTADVWGTLGGVDPGANLAGGSSAPMGTAAGTASTHPVVGFNFRSTLAFVTDGAGETFVGGSTSFGWDANASAANRSAVIDRRLAGVCVTAALNTWRHTLPHIGRYNVWFALGDNGASFSGNARLLDDGNELLHNGGGSHAAGSFDDANFALHTAANWPANNTPAQVDFTTTSLEIEMGAGGGARIAHFAYQYVGPTPP